MSGSVARRERLFDALEGELRPLQISRRRLLQLVASAGVLSLGSDCVLIQAIIDAVRNRRVRKEINTLGATDPDLVTFKLAVGMMKALPVNDQRNWLNQANIHANFCPHGNWLFLPWHRAYLYRFEEICRQLTGSTTFALPYWNWTKNPRVPAVFFDTTSPLYDSSRTVGPTTTISTAVTGAAVIDTIVGEPNFLLFASGALSAAAYQRDFAVFGPLEATPHNNVHTFIGGNMGVVALSPRDPVFWTHHNMIERIWVDWNMKRGHPNTNDPAWTGRHFTEFYDQLGSPVSVTVFEMILYPLLTYRYDDLP
jgi:tyrosinase